VTIEGGCFTTAVLKKHDIRELFDQPTGLNGNEIDLALMRKVPSTPVVFDNDDDVELNEVNPILNKVNSMFLENNNLAADDDYNNNNNFDVKWNPTLAQFEDVCLVFVIVESGWIRVFIFCFFV
jgi:hypothetical protein